VRSLLLGLSLIALNSFGQQVDPILAIPITDDFLNEHVLRAYFADVLRLGGYGHWHTERAAFIVREENGQYRCVAWPLDGGFHRQQFRGSIPDRTVAIVHTHPAELPIGSNQDARTAKALSVPIFVLTPLNIYLVTSRGENVPVVENRIWAEVSASSSTRCTPPASRASR
jgi:hypothetical protein